VDRPTLKIFEFARVAEKKLMLRGYELNRPLYLRSGLMILR